MHIFVTDAVACFQLYFNTHFHAPFEFFCKLVFSNDTLKFYKPVCLFLLFHEEISVIRYFHLVPTELTMGLNNPASSRIINFSILAERFNTSRCIHTHIHTPTLCVNLARAWLTSFMANSSSVLIKKIPQFLISCCGNRVIMFLNGLQLLVISVPILKLFAFLSLCSAWVQRALSLVKTTRR